MNKYMLTGESIVSNNITLYRIKALKSFSYVKEGELGGYIQREGNLSQLGNAWVSDDAKVCGDAWVFGNQRLRGKR